MKKKAGIILSAILIFAAAAAAQSPPSQALSLTLAECVERALKSNLDLSIEAFNPSLAEESKRITLEQFLPQFEISTDYYDRQIPSTWGVEGQTVHSKYDSMGFQLSTHLVTGTDVVLSGYSSMTDTNRAYTTINPSYDSQLVFSLSQKLLKGFGPAVNRYETTKAESVYDQSLGTLKAAVLSTVYQVEAAYWNLVNARESLRVIEASLAQSRDTLARDREAARIGSKTSVDVLSSETEVASRETSLLTYQASLEKAENQLKVLLAIPVEKGEGGADERVRIIPADKPSAERRTIALDEALRTARKERPEIANAESQLADAGLDVRYNRNQLLPDLSLNFAIRNPGQSGIKYVFQDDNYLTGIVIDKIEGSRWDSISNIFKQHYNNMFVTLTLNVPLANMLSRAALARARLSQDKARLTLEKARRDLEAEVLDAVKDLETAGRKIEASTRYRELMEKKVEAANEKYQLGLVDREWLFSYQSSLDQAKSSEIQAVTGYRIALAKLEQVMGTTIKAKGLKFRGFGF
ncbi:MAG: TolC family protein [Acidobacteriota bacterium]|nr:TolC family protein [Acidobacteriota bacterium]